MDAVPKHVAIIMDGNGRWAKRKGLSRSEGHKEGVRRVADIVDVALEKGVEVITLYTFSQENWKRPETEVSALMTIISEALERKAKSLIKKGIRLQMIGQRKGVPKSVLKRLDKTMALTAQGERLILNLAFNYGGRAEILDAVKAVAEKITAGKIAVEDVDENVFSRNLYTAGLPDPDLLIRTSGEMRISNFLLWQLSYAEFYFASECWPDFTEEKFCKALNVYAQRERRFGDVA